MAKFAAGGKPLAKKDLGLLAMTYGNVYVAQRRHGRTTTCQTIKAFLEAEAYDGPSLIIAYSHCIAHGIDMAKGMNNQKAAVESGHWPLYRYNPMLAAEGKNPFKLDSKRAEDPVRGLRLHGDTVTRCSRRAIPKEAKDAHGARPGRRRRTRWNGTN